MARKTSDNIDINALLGGSFLYRSPKGKTLEERYTPFNQYVDLLKLNGVYPFSRTVASTLGPEVYLTNTWADEDTPCLNFGSQDYMGMTSHPAVIQAAKDAIEEFGVTSGGTPVLGGRNTLTNKLEKKLAEVLHMEQAQVFASGWSACFGAIAGLVTQKDYIVMDMLQHNSSDVAANYATEHVYKFKHNDLEDLEKKLRFCTDRVGTGAIFVLIESLYSMNSDGPDLPAVYELCKKYQAILIIDVAHDFGCMGEEGRGLLETIDLKSAKDIVVMGSFSKTLCNPGGFVAGPRVIRQQIEIFSPSYTFASSISTISCAIIYKALEIAFSDEGKEIRKKLLANIEFAISELNKRGFYTNGIPSPFVPVLIGDSRLARLLSREILSMGLVANLIEFPAVPRNQSIIRFQMMGGMTQEQILQAVDIMHRGIIRSQELLLNAKVDAIEITPES
ncbi:MAG: pyridoxal phosphate-dependent aminotransferase family protein [Bacteroidetes bacterium]|nr:pyridoxal phosphate-dependent aminotransferase family protein [Bacteroidota bacterium]